LAGFQLLVLKSINLKSTWARCPEKLEAHYESGGVMPKARLRISGLVRARRWSEEALIQGLPVEEIQPFQSWLTSIFTQVETVCRKYQVSPQELPGPSRRAYEYLKALDTPELTQRLARNPKKKKTPKAQANAHNGENGVVRLRNLITIIENLHEMLYGIALVKPVNEVDKHLATKPILEKIQGHVKEIEELCRRSGSSPQGLPDPSLRAYQWLRFLSETGHLNAHLRALRDLVVQVESLRPKFPRRLRSMPVEVRFYNLPALYRSQVKDERLLLSANEAFIEAPPAVMENMLFSVLLPKKRQVPHRLAVRRYADTSAFTNLAQQVSGNSVETKNEQSRGRYYDLVAVFQRVNRQYFNDQMDSPRLVWGQRLARRKLGHYQPATDTVQVSRALDDPNVPKYVVDFIVYHELLHKQLGVQLSGGRRYSHTPAFKKAEKRFRKFEEAQEFLKSIGDKLEL
jgi:hypothetical protein